MPFIDQSINQSWIYIAHTRKASNALIICCTSLKSCCGWLKCFYRHTQAVHYPSMMKAWP